MTTDNSQTEVRLFYKEITQLLRSKYNPHYNLYQKQQLADKVKCYQENPNRPDLYYDCISVIDTKMVQNSQQLQFRFNSIEQNDKDCQDICVQSFKEDGQKKNQCILKCLENMKQQCLNLQDQFYETQLKTNAEYKKIKK